MIYLTAGFRSEIIYEQPRCIVNIMIPYRYAGFLFANRTTFPKFVTERERGYYSDRDLSKRIPDEIDVNGRVINSIGLLILGA